MINENKKELPEEKFKRIATLRTNVILEKIRILGKLSDKQRYKYTDEDINKIFSAINKQIKEVRIKFQSQGQKNFRL